MLSVIVYDGDNIISAEVIEDPVFVKYQSINNSIVRCSKVKAQGVVSKDGSQIYQLKGRPLLSGEHFIAEETSQMDAEALITQLELPEQLNPIEEDEPVEQEVDASIMTAMQMRERIIDLEQQVAEKSEQISFLEDCLLEMSEILYE